MLQQNNNSTHISINQILHKLLPSVLRREVELKHFLWKYRAPNMELGGSEKRNQGNKQSWVKNIRDIYDFRLKIKYERYIGN